MSQQEKGTAFAALHRGEPFVIPNPWDAGSARVLAALGFKALATTSSGFAFTLGRADGGATIDEVETHVRALTAATNLPLSVDLEDGYGPTPEDVADAIRRIAAAGAVGASIEDWVPGRGFYPRAHAVARIVAAADAAANLDHLFILTARAENYLRGNPNLKETIARLQAYSAAGADVLYAPNLPNTSAIRAVCRAVDKPVNVLVGGRLSLAEIVAAGAQRISTGGRLAWVAVDAGRGG